MKISKRILGAALSGVLLAGSLAGCASNPGGNNTPAPSGSDNQYTGTSSPAPSVSTRPVGESVPLVATEDVVQAIPATPPVSPWTAWASPRRKCSTGWAT